MGNESASHSGKRLYFLSFMFAPILLYDGISLKRLRYILSKENVCALIFLCSRKQKQTNQVTIKLFNVMLINDRIVIKVK